MNQPTAYEQLIAQKLQELAVPEQADAIWATIEHQLNIEMPGGDPGPGGGSHGNWWMGGGSLLTFFVAVITYISISNQHFDNQRHPREQPAGQHAKPVKKDRKQPSENDRTEKLPAKTFPPRTGSAPHREPADTDTVPAAKKPEITAEPAMLPQPGDTIAPPRKPRGVRGISDADYRLVPAPRDSTRRKN